MKCPVCGKGEIGIHEDEFDDHYTLEYQFNYIKQELEKFYKQELEE
jgi:hypothetical protein